LLLVLVVVGSAMMVFPQYQAERYLAKLSDADKQKPDVQKNAFDIENATRLTIAQIVGGFALLVGLYFTYENVKVAQENAKTAQDNLRLTEEGKITDRFSKAVEMLGSEKLDVRLGGIYALERICRDSQRDHWTVMEILTAYVRENSPYDVGAPTDAKMREDIQAIMTVIGRRKWLASETRSLDLRNVNLRGCVLYKANLAKAQMDGSNLSFAVLSSANLQGAMFGATNFELASLYSANLEDTYLNHANLTRADMQKANMNYAKFVDTDLADASFRMTKLTNANLREAKHLTLDQILMTDDFTEDLLPSDLRIALQEQRAKDAEEERQRLSPETRAE
jgi:hypothetical protein